MTKSDYTTESLEKASHSLQFAVDDLQVALHNGTVVEGEILIPLIAEVACLRRTVTALQAAREADKE